MHFSAPKLHVSSHLLFSAYLGVSIAALIFLGFFAVRLENRINGLNTQISSVNDKQQNLEQNLPEELFGDHLQIMQNESLQEDILTLENEIGLLKGQTNPTIESIQQILASYDDFKKKLLRNSNVKIDTKSSQDKVSQWASNLLEKNYTTLNDDIKAETGVLDVSYNKYLASLPPPPTVTAGYSTKAVSTEKGTFNVYMIKVPLNEVRVKTVAAISSDCKNNCATKSLADYVKEQGGFAGITGSYACPADYAECANKLWSFDYALYDSADHKWLNKKALTWFKTGMITFKGNSSNFYKKTSDYDGDSVDAAVSNFPSLLKDNEIAVNDGDLTSYQKVKAFRGAIGTGSESLYLVYASNASVRDMAYIMRSIGAKNALNLDGGGTAAMYIDGKYMVGPGRPLANAIVLVR